MKKGVSAGGVVVKHIDNIPYILMIKFEEYGGTVAFPKGHVEKGESLENAAVREVYEETGIRVNKTVKKLGVVKRLSGEKDEMKTIHLYLMETDNFSHQDADEDYGWFTPDEALQKMAFPEEKEFLNKIKSEIK